MYHHEVRTQRPGERFPRERELAWRLAEVACDPVPVEPEAAEMAGNRLLDDVAVAVAALDRDPPAAGPAPARGPPPPGGASRGGRGPETPGGAEGGAIRSDAGNPAAGAPGGRGNAAAPRRGVRGRICRRPNPASRTRAARGRAGARA